MEPSPDPDRALVLACQQGTDLAREEAFRELHDRHDALVRRICWRITGNASDALDAAQETFLLAFVGIGSFRFRARFARWLARVATCVALDHLRRRRPPRPFSELDRDSGQDQVEPCFALRADPHESAERRELRARVRRALRRLSPQLRDVLVLRYFEGFSNTEIERRLSIAAGSVKSRLHRAHGAPLWKSDFPREAERVRARPAAAGAGRS